MKQFTFNFFLIKLYPYDLSYLSFYTIFDLLTNIQSTGLSLFWFIVYNTVHLLCTQVIARKLCKLN
uniref:Unkown protein n=1 Tax=Riptortus pedestris TaxID=329032 RepID=R4WKQ0_RIPPE|nr:unkown protein [Riptortus pedestris]